MERTSIADLKAHLSAYLRKVKAGETVLVLDRGRPVARIEPVDTAQEGDARLARLEAAGVLSRPKGPMPMDLLREPGPRPAKSVVEALIEERRDDR